MFGASVEVIRQSGHSFCFTIWNKHRIRVNSIHVTSDRGNLYLQADGSVSDWDISPKWFANIKDFSLSGKTISFISKNLNGTDLKVPEIVKRMGNLRYRGIIGGTGKTL